MPQELPGTRIERVDAFARVYDQFIVFRPANHHWCAMRNPIVAPIDLPTLLASALVECQQYVAIASATAIFSFGLFEQAPRMLSPKITIRK